MKYLIFTIFSLCCLISYAQKDTTLYGYIDSTTYKKVEITVVPGGGQATWNRFLEKNLNYPSSAKKKHIKGKVVVDFTVAADRTISDYKIVKSLSADLDNEAIRLVSTFPLWMTAVNNGQHVNFRNRIEIEFPFKNE